MQALIQQVENRFAGEVVPNKAPVEGHEKSNGEVERAGQFVGGLARTLKEFLEICSGKALCKPPYGGLGIGVRSCLVYIVSPRQRGRNDRVPKAEREALENPFASLGRSGGV